MMRSPGFVSSSTSRAQVIFGQMAISDDEFYNDGLHEMTPDEHKRYRQQIKESQGFDVDLIPNVFACCIIQPAPIDHDFEPVLRHFTQFAIDHHNNNEGGNLKLVRIIKCNWQGACPINYYITFEAEDVTSGDVDTYQTKVEKRIITEKSKVTIFRKKHKQQGNQEKEVESSVSRIEQLQHESASKATELDFGTVS